MNPEKDKKDWERMRRELIDPEEQLKARQREEMKKIREEKVKDTGL